MSRFADMLCLCENDYLTIKIHTQNLWKNKVDGGQERYGSM